MSDGNNCKSKTAFEPRLKDRELLLHRVVGLLVGYFFQKNCVCVCRETAFIVLKGEK